MPQYDGSIRIVTKITTKDAEESLASLEWQIKKSAKYMDELRSKMDTLKNQKIPTKNYKDLQEKLSVAEKELKELVAEQERYNEIGITSGDAWNKLNEKVANASDSVDLIKEKMQALTDAGRDFTLGKDTAQYAAYERQLQYEEKAVEKAGEHYQQLLKQTPEMQKQTAEEERLAQIKANAAVSDQRIIDALERRKQLLAEIKDMEAVGVGLGTVQYDSAVVELQQVESEIRKYKDSLSEVPERFSRMRAAAQKAFSAVRSGLSKIGSIGKKAFSSLASMAGKAFSKIGKDSKKSSGLLSTCASRMKGLAFSLLIFNWISKGFNAMISGMKQGFSNFAGYSADFANSIQSMKSAMSTLGNQMAAAFAPLVQAVIPLLNSLINTLTKATAAIAQFIAALTGKGTFVKAKKQQDAYNKSLGGTASAAKKALGALAGFDDLDVLQKQDNVGGGGGAGGADFSDMFEEQDVSPEIVAITDKIKEAWSGIWGVFKQAWEKIGKPVIDSAKKAFESLGLLIESIGTTIYEVFTGGVGLEWVESILVLFRSILDVITAISDAFRTAWDAGDGVELITNIFDAFTQIHLLIAAIADSFSRVFSNGTGAKILSNILGIISGIFKIVGNLAEQFRIAWETAGLGDSIMQGILNLVNLVLETIHNIVDATAEWAEKLDFTPLLTSIDELLKALEPLTENIGKGLEWFWNNVLLPIAGWTIEDAIPAFLDMLSAAIGVLNDVIDVFKPLGKWLWDEFLEPLGKWTGDLIIAAMETVTDLLTKFGDWVSDHKDSVNDFVTTLKDNFDKLKEVAKNLWEDVLVPFGKFVSDVLSPAFELLKTILENLWNNVISPLASFIKDTFQKAFESLCDILNDAVIPKVQSVIDTMQDLWDNILEPVAKFISGTFCDAWNNAGDSIKTMIDGAKKLMDGLLDFITGVFTKDWEKAWDGLGEIVDGIKGVIKGAINGILGFVESMVNGFIRALNEIIDKLKTFASIKNPITGGVIWEPNISKLDEVYIPKLARGGVIKGGSPFLAWLGDQPAGQKNIEAPLATIEKALDNVLDRRENKRKKADGTDQTAIVAINIGGNQAVEFLTKMKDQILSIVQDLVNGILSGNETIQNSTHESSSEITSAVTLATSSISDSLKLTLDNLNLASNEWISRWKIMVDNTKASCEQIVSAITSMSTSVHDMCSSMLAAIAAVKAAASSMSSGTRVGMSSFSSVSGHSISTRDIPQLATGAVIRGGNPFMAILGDQPSGQTNVEAPLSTIEQALENVISRNGYGRESVPVNINLNYDGQTFARLSIPDILAELKRQGYDVSVLGVT